MICTCSSCLKKTRMAKVSRYEYFTRDGYDYITEYECPSCIVKDKVHHVIRKIHRSFHILSIAKKLKTDKYSWRTIIAISAKICK